VPPPIERVKNRYRLQVLIKGALTMAIRRELMDSYRVMAERQRGGRGVDLRWDVDPESFY
jgi:primosomal protein N'